MDTRIALGRHWIGGHWTQSTGAGEGESPDPATGRPIGRFAAGSAPGTGGANSAPRHTLPRSARPQKPRRRPGAPRGW